MLATSIPCSIVAVLLTALYLYWTRYPLTTVALHGALAAAVGIVGATAWTLIRPHIKGVGKLYIAGFVVSSFLLSAMFHITPIVILLLAGFVGATMPGAKRI